MDILLLIILAASVTIAVASIVAAVRNSNKVLTMQLAVFELLCNGEIRNSNGKVCTAHERELEACKIVRLLASKEPCDYGKTLQQYAQAYEELDNEETI